MKKVMIVMGMLCFSSAVYGIEMKLFLMDAIGSFKEGQTTVTVSGTIKKGLTFSVSGLEQGTLGGKKITVETKVLKGDKARGDKKSYIYLERIIMELVGTTKVFHLVEPLHKDGYVNLAKTLLKTIKEYTTKRAHKNYLTKALKVDILPTSDYFWARRKFRGFK